MVIVLIILYTLSLLFIFAYSLVQIHLVITYTRFHLKKKKHRYSYPYPPPPPQPQPEMNEASWPAVTVQLPVYNEMYVVERLIDNIAQLDYPHDKLEIQVLDDSTDETLDISRRKVSEWLAKGLPIRLINRTRRTGFKAGALQEGMKTAGGTYIAIFDADFLPTPDFLKKTIPYLTADPGLGVVQTRWEHLNKDYSFLTRIQAFALDAHFTVEQQGRNAGGFFINFNGTAGVWRSDCIRDAGGWQADTLTEDLDLSYRAQLKGWKFLYLEDFGSPAELPVLMNAVKSQQFRWTKGGAETARKNIGRIWKSDSTLPQKIHGTAHLLSNQIFLCVLLCSVLSVPLLALRNTAASPLLADWFLLLTFFFISLFFVGIFYYCSIRRRFQTGLRAMGHFLPMFPAFLSISMGISLHNSIAGLEGLLGFKSPFIRTPKFNISSKSTTKSGSWKSNKYREKSINLLTILELAMTLYFLAGMGTGIYYGDYGLLPYHFMLFMGFGSVFGYSVKH